MMGWETLYNVDGEETLFKAVLMMHYYLNVSLIPFIETFPAFEGLIQIQNT